MKITTKGQVTVPQHVREQLGLFPGTEVDFVVKGKTAHIVKAPQKNGEMSRGERIVARITGQVPQISTLRRIRSWH